MMMLKPGPIMIVRANARVSLNPIMIVPVSRRPVSLYPIMSFRAGRARVFRGMMMEMMMTLLWIVFVRRAVSTGKGRTSCAMTVSNGYGMIIDKRGVQFPAS